jgi:hypothetical protein
LVNEEILKGTEQGIECSGYIETDGKVPDVLLCKLLENKVESIEKGAIDTNGTQSKQQNDTDSKVGFWTDFQSPKINFCF